MEEIVESSAISELPVPERTTLKANQRPSHFFLLLIMEFVTRTGYQMGKSPVLPLFALALGAGPEMSGTIVAVSTITGLITSPLIGTMSDRYGRRGMLMLGTAVFALMPFTYLLIRTPAQLVVVRFVHGFATAIYGPVVAALVADMFKEGLGRRMGLYRSVRTSGYLLGPLLGGLVLTYANFRLAWVLVGVFGLVAFIPLVGLFRGRPPVRAAKKEAKTKPSLLQDLLQGFRNPTLLALGVVQAVLFLGLRANKAFWPLYAVSAGIGPTAIGVVFGIQVAATLFAQPIGGYLSDRMGRKPVIVMGLLLLGGGLPLMVMTDDFAVLVLLSACLGLAEAAIMPSITALGPELSERHRYGSTLGMLDAMDNVGKALGPILAGLLLGFLSYVTSFAILAGLTVGVAVIFSVMVRELGEH